MVETADLAEDEAFKGGFGMCRKLRDVQVLVPGFLEEAILDAVVGVDGECDVEEVDCA